MLFRRLAKDSAIRRCRLRRKNIVFTFPIIASTLSPKAFGALGLIFTASALLGLV